MEKTFKRLAVHFEAARTHEIVPGRKSKYIVPDVIRVGQNLAMTQQANGIRGERDSEWEDVEEEEEEIEEVGDLDVQ